MQITSHKCGNFRHACTRSRHSSFRYLHHLVQRTHWFFSSTKNEKSPLPEALAKNKGGPASINRENSFDNKVQCSTLEDVALDGVSAAVAAVAVSRGAGAGWDSVGGLRGGWPVASWGAGGGGVDWRDWGGGWPRWVLAALWVPGIGGAGGSW